jgi:SAM-dependent methyltransferase
VEIFHFSDKPGIKMRLKVLVSKIKNVLFDNTNPNSFSSIIRKRRKKFFYKTMEIDENSHIRLKILDLGCGTGMVLNEIPNVIGVNITPQKTPYKYLVLADARFLPFKSKSIDILFSNSLIEHISPQDRKKVADEIMRVAKKFFIQTPYRYFPLEPHYLIPFISFFPRKFQMKILKAIPQKVYFGWYPKEEEIYLLDIKEAKKLFPNAKIKIEFFLFLPKSIYIIKK